jgi:hypothetical protein
MTDSGVVLEDSCLTASEFVKYRTEIEPFTSLAHDLTQSGIGLLPSTQQRWVTVKDRIKECIAIRPPEYTVDKDPGKKVNIKI